MSVTCVGVTCMCDIHVSVTCVTVSVRCDMHDSECSV